MKKLKINEKQADMLKELGKRKVMKITQEQYDKIIEMKGLDGISSMLKSASPPDRPAFKDSLTKAKSSYLKIGEMYDAFINELYGMNEGTKKVYEKLHKLMEVAGIIKDGRLVKEKFNGDKNRVKEVISAGLNEMANGGSPYRAMEAIEEALKASDITADYLRQQFTQPSSGSDTTSIADKRAAELERRKQAGEPVDVERKNALNALAKGEQEQKLEEEGNATPDGIVGLDILNHEPFASLPNTRGEVDWKNRGDARVPSLDRGDSSTSIFSKEEVVNYIKQYTNKFGEDPIFELNPTGAWYERVNVINPSFIDWRDKSVSDIGKILANDRESGFSTDESTEDSEEARWEKAYASFKDNLRQAHTPKSKPSTGETEPDKEDGIKKKGQEGEKDIDEVTGAAAVNASAPIVKMDKMGSTIYKSNVELEEETGMSGIPTYDTPPNKDKAFWTAGNKENKHLEEGANETRYVVEMDFYIWAADDEQAKQVAQSFAQDMDKKYDNQPRVQKLFRQPFGTMGSQEVPLNEDSHTETQWKGGSFVNVKEKCKVFPYCDEGPGAIETRKTKKSVISNDHIIQEIAKKTGKSIEQVSRILEAYQSDEITRTLDAAEYTNKLISDNIGLVMEFKNGENYFLLKFNEPMTINRENSLIMFKYEISEDGGKTWQKESKHRQLSESAYGTPQYQLQNHDNKLIQAGIDNAKRGMVTDYNTLEAINKTDLA